jgi:hypothetical protein
VVPSHPRHPIRACPATLHTLLPFGNGVIPATVGATLLRDAVAIGRPTKLTPEAVEIAARLSAQGCSIPTIAQEIGVHKVSIYNWIKDGEEARSDLARQFLYAIQSGAGKVEQTCLNALARALHSEECRDSTPAAQWMLTHHPKLRDRWSDAAATRREVDRVIGMVATGVANSGLTPEQKQAVLLSIRASGVGLDDAETP